MDRELEIVTDAGNNYSRFTITPDRLTIKVAEQDLADTEWFAELGLAVASQISANCGIRGTVRKDSPYFTLSNKAKTKDNLVEYKFETLTAKLV